MNSGPYQPPQNNNGYPYNSQYPYQPGQFPPPGYNGPPPPYNRPPAPPQPPPHRYRGWTLTILAIVYIASVIMVFTDAAFMSGTTTSSDSTSSASTLGVVGNFGIFLLIVLNIFIIFKDGRTFFSLFGKFHWQRMKVWQRVLLGIVYLGAMFMSAAYLVMAIQHHLRMNQLTLGVALKSGWRGYRERRSISQIGIALVSAFLILVYVVFTVFGAMTDRTLALQHFTPTAQTQQISATATPTDTPVLSAVDTSVSTTVVSPTATATPTPKPTPTARPTPKPTPQPTPTPCANPCNPWGYNFTPGNYITSPPSNFCVYFNCISNFSNGRGFVNECQDGTYSKSGGISGDCSHHGGEMRPLYSH